MLDNDPEEVTSKTARKREATRLQALGKKLSDLKSAQLADFDLPDDLLAAILDHQRFPSREAKRRQLQFVGKLMRKIDADAVEARLETFEGQSRIANYVNAQCETWRERLIAEKNSVAEYIDAHPSVDRQQLRQLIRRAQSAPDEKNRKTAARALYRYLHEIETQA
ncbi:MAG: DUF615 domain-containing protein [Pseudomonadales bacterium]|nr:DUF615 domain-containing protein [Pseudomonadales bacterium]